MNTTPPDAAAPELGPPPVPRRESAFYYADSKKPKYMLACNEAELPEVCLITGVPTGPQDRRKRRLLSYSPPWILLTLLGGLIPFVLLMLILSKKMYITYSLSDEARRKIANKQRIAFVICMLGIGLIVLSVVNENGIYLLGAFLALIVGLIMAITSEPIKAAGHRNEWFRISGVSPDFLSTLEPRQF